MSYLNFYSDLAPSYSTTDNTEAMSRNTDSTSRWTSVIWDWWIVGLLLKNIYLLVSGSMTSISNSILIQEQYFNIIPYRPDFKS